jgi:hypothetical protein
MLSITLANKSSVKPTSHKVEETHRRSSLTAPDTAFSFIATIDV